MLLFPGGERVSGNLGELLTNWLARRWPRAAAGTAACATFTGLSSKQVGKPDVGLHQVAPSRRATLVSDTCREHESYRDVPFIYGVGFRMYSHASTTRAVCNK